MSSFERILPFVKPIEHLLRDPTITEVMVNAGGRRVFVERDGVLCAVENLMLDERNLRVAIKNIARTCGDEISASAKFCPSCGAAQAVVCPSCGAPAIGRFCAECGSPVHATAEAPTPTPAPAARTAERRITSVLFGDLVGFTTLSESSDPEQVRGRRGENR